MNLLGVVVVIAAGFAALLVSLLGGGGAWEDATAASRVCEAVQAWKAKGLHATKVWRVREVLARQWWLGPLRPNPPLDPLAACGFLPAETKGCSWWHLLLQPHETRQLLACLEDGVPEAEGDHVAFAARLFRGAVLGLVVATLGILSACFFAHRAAQVTRGQQGTMSQACGVAATGAAVDASKDISASALMEQWATTAAGMEEDLEEVWATPPGDEACENLALDDVGDGERQPAKKKRRRRKKKNPAADIPEPAEEAGVSDGKDPSSEVEVDEKVEVERLVPEDEVLKAVPKKMDEKKRNVAVCEKVKKASKMSRKFAPAQHRAAPPSQHTQGVRQSWQEDVVTVELPVPPPMRQHVIGPRGDTVRQLRQIYPSVHVAVPPLQDTTSANINIRGPKSQAAAVAQDIAGRLAVIETQIREAERRRQEARATAVLDVAPNMRRFVVGPGGEELWRLSQQHPGVRVSVPPPSDTESRSVTIRGPPAEVAAVQASITARLEVLERRRQLQRERNRRRRQAAAAKGRG